jgi:cytochrome b6-f complex iron-sulfur subunit
MSTDKIISVEPEEKLTVADSKRRDFLKVFLSTGLMGFAAITMYPVISFLKPPKQREVEVTSMSIGITDDFKPGDSKIIRFGKTPVLVIKDEEENFKAFSATCTHLDCTVQYKKDEKIIWCACHNGKYDMQGRNIAGPPPRPLDKYLIKIKNNEVFVTTNS